MVDLKDSAGGQGIVDRRETFSCSEIRSSRSLVGDRLRTDVWQGISYDRVDPAE